MGTRALDLIYCAGGNRRFYEIARAAGFLYGARLPDTTYGPLHFADQEYKAPNRAAYMRALAEKRPAVATVLDLEHEEQHGEVLNWAEEAAAWVTEAVVIIPKLFGIVAALPREIAGREVRLGYSVPTRYGGTAVPSWEFGGWPVHLLGGQPHHQMQLARYMDVRSCDGNYHQKMAVERSQFWVPGTARGCRNRYWPQLREVGAGLEKDAPYEAFTRSCANIIAAWRLAGYDVSVKLAGSC